MKPNREGFRENFREAIRLLQELMRAEDFEDDLKDDCQSIIDKINEGWDDLEIHFDQVEEEHRKQGGKFGFLPGGQVFLDDDELETGDGE